MIKWLETEVENFDLWKDFITSIIENVDSISSSWIDFSQDELKSWVEAKLNEFDSLWICTLVILLLRGKNTISDSIEENSLYSLTWFLEENKERNFVSEIEDIVKWITDFDTYLKLKIKENFIEISDEVDNIEKLTNWISEIIKYSFFKTLKK